jgi:plasmid stabilization system protein ParE
MKVIWTQESVLQLIEIEDFISNDSPKRAAEFVDEIIDHAEAVLPDTPSIGRIVPEINNANIRELIFKKYRIVYRANKNNIEILTVFEGHRLLRIDELKNDEDLNKSLKKGRKDFIFKRGTFVE